MCGLIGAVGRNTLPASVDKFLKNGLVVDAVRGAHSTGVVQLTKTISKGKEKRFYAIHKAAICGGEFVENMYDPASMNANTYAVLGHNRYATVGGITDSTAHPFHIGNVIGAHNGTLRGDWIKAMNCPHKTEVDSMGLMHSLNYRGYKKTFESLTGAVATVWHDTQTCRTFVYRNRERPLHYAITTSGVVIYGSEKLMLEWLIDRNKIYIKGDVESFDTDTVYEITDGEVKILEKVSGIQPPTTTYNSARSSYSASNSYGTGYDRYCDIFNDDYLSTYYGSSTTTEEASCEDDLQRDDVFTDMIWPIYGDMVSPTGREYCSTGMVNTEDNSEWLSIRVPDGFSEQSLRNIGYKYQKGVAYRDSLVTPYEKARGIVQEIAELVSVNSVLSCDYDDMPCPDEYLESLSINGLVILSPENLSLWRDENADTVTKFRKVILRNLSAEAVANARPIDKENVA